MNRYEKYLKATGTENKLRLQIDSKKTIWVYQINEQLGPPQQQGDRIIAYDETGHEHRFRAFPYNDSPTGYGWFY
jgi:hypothetical protein